MFVETKREGEVTEKQGPSLAGFIAWLEQQSPDETYCVWVANSCALAQYYTSIKLPYPIMVAEAATDFGVSWRALYRVLGTIDDGRVAFGQALRRARVLRDSN